MKKRTAALKEAEIDTLLYLIWLINYPDFRIFSRIECILLLEKNIIKMVV